MLKKFETRKRENQAEIDTLLVYFWIVMCMDYFAYYQKDNQLFKKEQNKFFAIRNNCYSVVENILINYKFDDYLLELDRQGNNTLKHLPDVNNLGVYKDYQFNSIEYPIRKIKIMADFLRPILPLTNVYISSEMSTVVLENFENILTKNCNLDVHTWDTFNSSESVKDFESLYYKLKQKMMHKDKFDLQINLD